MKPNQHTLIELKRDCNVTLIPSGEKSKLQQGDYVMVMQALGGNFTVRTDMGYLALINALDADALGLESKAEKEEAIEAGPFNLEKVIEKLKTVFDPEIPVNVVDLGLIYVCKAHPPKDEGSGHRIEIKMSMTAPGCGMGDVLKAEARDKVRVIPDVADVDIEIVWEPAWDPSRMSEAARLQLGML